MHDISHICNVCMLNNFSGQDCVVSCNRWDKLQQQMTQNRKPEHFKDSFEIHHIHIWESPTLSLRLGH